MTTPQANWTPAEAEGPGEADAQVDAPATDAPGTDVPGTDALSAAGRALEAVDNLPLERHPEAFAHFDELLRAALEAPPQVASG